MMFFMVSTFKPSFRRGLFYLLLLAIFGLEGRSEGQTRPLPQLLAVVDGNVLSTYDLDQISRVILLDSGRAPIEENMKAFQLQAWRLIRDMNILSNHAKQRLQPQQLEAFDSWFEQKMIETETERMLVLLDEFKVSRPWFRAWMRNVYLWQIFVQETVRRTVEISPIEAEHEITRRRRLDRLGGYQVSILKFLSNDQDSANLREKVDQAMLRLKLGTNFSVLSREALQSDAMQIIAGWIATSELEDRVAEAAEQTPAGEIYPEPIVVKDGLAILKVDSKIKPGSGRSFQLKRIEVTNQDSLARLLGGHWRCGETGQTLLLSNPELSGTVIGGEQSLTVSMSALSEEFQTALAEKKPGEAVGPFGLENQPFILLVCDIIDTEVDRQSIIEELKQQSAERLTDQLQRHLVAQADVRPIGVGGLPAYAPLFE